MLLLQESFFQWVCGVQEPGSMVALRVRDGRCVVFVPRLPEEYAVWMGRLRTVDEFKTKYAVEQVNYMDEVRMPEFPRGWAAFTTH